MYRRIFDYLRRTVPPKILPRFQVCSRIHPNDSSNPSYIFSGFSTFFSRQVGLGSFPSLGKTNMIAYSPFLGCPNRFYNVSHLKRLIEMVPYTKRARFILLSNPMEKLLEETLFEDIKIIFEEYILPETHPESIRVRLIFKKITDAFQRDLSHECVWRDCDRGVKEMKMSLSEGGGEKTKEDQILNDKWIHQKKKKDLHATNTHLERINWEILVVNIPIVNAFCLSGGKIVVFTGLLEQLKSDAEVATAIGHEVGHAVARHLPENITNTLWFGILQLMFYLFVISDLVTTVCVVSLLVKRPLSRMMEMEADYIGLLLLASAGYDPRVAPKVYEKLGNDVRYVRLKEYLLNHPSGKKRSQILSQTNVMEEALVRYREVQARRGN